MPRKQKVDPNGYDKAFPQALRKLLADSGTTKKDLAAHLNRSGQAIAYYCDGTSSPDWETIVEIAKYFSVSTDYLLGATDDPAPRPSAVDDLGLSPKAVQYLRILYELANPPYYDTRIYLLSNLLENRRFDDLITQWLRYVRLMSIEPETSFLGSDDYIFHYDALKTHGFAISPPKEQAYAIFSESIVTTLRFLLDEMSAMGMSL